MNLDNRKYIEKWRDSDMKYELSHMIEEVKVDVNNLTVQAILSLYQGRRRPSKSEVKKLLLPNVK